MFASYRLEVSQTQFGSEGSIAINNTLQLPDDKLSLHTFKTALLNSVEELLPKIFETYLLNQELKETLDQRLSEESALLASEPSVNQQEELYERDLRELPESDSTDEEWLERYGRNF